MSSSTAPSEARAAGSTRIGVRLALIAATMFAAEYLRRRLHYCWFAHATITQSMGVFCRVNWPAPVTIRPR